MIRMLGTITGSALAVALLLLIVGIPQFRAPTSVAEQTVMTLPLPTRPVEAAEQPAADLPVADDVQSPPLDEVPMPANVGLATATERQESLPPAELAPIEATMALDEAIALPPSNEPQWHTFWSPFRSEIAANGFVARLQSVTGLDYRIVRVKPGVYEVSFAYSDNEEIDTSLSQITAATGLDLRER